MHCKTQGLLTAAPTFTWLYCSTLQYSMVIDFECAVFYCTFHCLTQYCRVLYCWHVHPIEYAICPQNQRLNLPYSRENRTLLQYLLPKRYSRVRTYCISYRMLGPVHKICPGYHNTDSSIKSVSLFFVAVLLIKSNLSILNETDFCNIFKPEKKSG